MSEARALIVGGGLAGLTCARGLIDQGWRVWVVDKGRGPGGRMSTRRADREQAHPTFDHGAQYFSARDPGFRQRVAHWQERGTAAAWEGRVVELHADGTVTDKPGERFVGTPRMSSVIRDEADQLPDVRHSLRVQELARDERRHWTARCADGQVLEGFQAVVVATPAAQAVPLLAAGGPALQDPVREVVVSPCYAVMASFESRLALDWDAAFVRHGPLAWAARDSSKPGRDAAQESWVLHGSPAWSAEQLERPPEEIAPLLLAELAHVLGGPLPATGYLRGHRWRYAQVQTPLVGDARCGWDEGLGIGFCGDWCVAGRVEGAYLSGAALAARIGAPR